MLEKTAAKNSPQRKAHLKTKDQDWNPYISPPGKLANWQSLSFPLLHIKRYQTRSIQVKSLSLSKFEAAPKCCPEGVAFPPRNVLIIMDICIFHAQLNQKNSTLLHSKDFYISFQIAMGIVRVTTIIMVRFTAIAP